MSPDATLAERHLARCLWLHFVVEVAHRQGIVVAE